MIITMGSRGQMKVDSLEKAQEILERQLPAPDYFWGVSLDCKVRIYDPERKGMGRILASICPDHYGKFVRLPSMTEGDIPELARLIIEEKRKLETRR